MILPAVLVLVLGVLALAWHKGGEQPTREITVALAAVPAAPATGAQP